MWRTQQPRSVKLVVLCHWRVSKDIAFILDNNNNNNYYYYYYYYCYYYYIAFLLVKARTPLSANRTARGSLLITAKVLISA